MVGETRREICGPVLDSGNGGVSSARLMEELDISEVPEPDDA